MEQVKSYHIRSNLPKNFEVVTKHDIIRHQLDIINAWKPWTDMWALAQGNPILAGAGALSSLYINRRFRSKLKMRNYGSLISALGLFTAPAVTIYLMQNQLILYKMLTWEGSCPICLESKAALIQIFGGLVVPLIGVPFANFSVASTSGKFNVPYQFDFKGMSKLILSIYRPLIPKLTLIFTFHALLAGFVTHSQIKSFIYMEQIQHLVEEYEKNKYKLSDD